METPKIDDKQFDELLESLIKYHEQKLNEYRQMRAISGTITGKATFQGTLGVIDEKLIIYGATSAESKPKKPTLEDRIKVVLKTINRPLTSRDLMETVNQKYPERPISSFKSFSAQLTPIHQKTDSGIKLYTIRSPDSKIKHFFYGLDEWFDGEDLKLEYQIKITKNYVP